MSKTKPYEILCSMFVTITPQNRRALEKKSYLGDGWEFDPQNWRGAGHSTELDCSGSILESHQYKLHFRSQFWLNSDEILQIIMKNEQYKSIISLILQKTSWLISQIWYLYFMDHKIS